MFAEAGAIEHRAKQNQQYSQATPVGVDVYLAGIEVFSFAIGAQRRVRSLQVARGCAGETAGEAASNLIQALVFSKSRIPQPCHCTPAIW